MIKCAGCNVVICEVLAFIRNQLDLMDNESLIRICVTGFSEEDIDEAKKLLFSTIKTNKKIVSRRKEKKLKDLEDIITIFKTTDPDLVPIFVAYDLHRLPPVCFDHVDVTKLLKDIVSLRAEVTDIKNNYVKREQLDEVYEKLKENHSPNPVFNSNVNKLRGSGYTQDSGPFGLTVEYPHTSLTEAHDCRTNPAPSDDEGEAPQYRSLVCAPAQVNPDEQDGLSVMTTVMRNPGVNQSKVVERTVDKSTVRHDTMVEVLKKGEWKVNKPDEGWIKVQKKRHRNQFEGNKGVAITSSTGNFKAAEIKVPLFISNVSKGTLESDICEYIQKMTNENVKLEKINMKEERPYNAYKLFVTKGKLDAFLDKNLWPEGITFRRFYSFKERIKKQEGQVQPRSLEENQPT